jgi:hypothetical protein
MHTLQVRFNRVEPLTLGDLLEPFTKSFCRRHSAEIKEDRPGCFIHSGIPGQFPSFSFKKKNYRNFHPQITRNFTYFVPKKLFGRRLDNWNEGDNIAIRTMFAF